jgi:two-component system, chemotaxis family, chemotaxis protein CheY
VCFFLADRYFFGRIVSERSFIGGNCMGQQILIVDDSGSIRQSMKYVVEQAGYSVVEAANGKEALAVITPQTKLVVTDINMPEMDGIEFIKRVRSGTAPLKTIPIIILTTESQPEMKQKGKDAGATAWIVKPFPPEDIIAAIKKLIG